MIEIDYIEGKITEKDSEFGIQVAELQKIVAEYNALPPKDFPIVDFVISFGGDGTYHRTVRKELAARPNRPVLFVRPSRNRSSGVMADIEFDQLRDVLERIKNGRSHIQTLPRMDVFVNRENLGSFFGDMWIAKAEGFNTIEMELESEYTGAYADEDLGIVYSMRHYYDIVKADGIMFYLPIASTAYNKVLGGPICDWDTPIFGVRYIAPCRTIAGGTGYQCSTKDTAVHMRFAGWSGEKATLQLDWMEKGVPIKYGDEIRICKSNDVTKLLRVMPETIYEKQVRHDEMHNARARSSWKDNSILKDVRG